MGTLTMFWCMWGKLEVAKGAMATRFRRVHQSTTHRFRCNDEWSHTLYCWALLWQLTRCIAFWNGIIPFSLSVLKLKPQGFLSLIPTSDTRQNYARTRNMITKLIISGCADRMVGMLSPTNRCSWWHSSPECIASQPLLEAVIYFSKHRWRFTSDSCWKSAVFRAFHRSPRKHISGSYTFIPWHHLFPA